MQSRIINQAYEDVEQQTIESLSLHDLMGQDWYVYMTKNKDGYQLNLEDEDGNQVNGINIHPCAMESMIKVCTRFILHYNQIRKSEAA